ncbi:hypothetical protein DINM_002198 [Dirofilaria immitis]|nr:hypothetical protein [Dirofilaria immitis]
MERARKYDHVNLSESQFNEVQHLDSTESQSCANQKEDKMASEKIAGHALFSRSFQIAKVNEEYLRRNSKPVQITDTITSTILTSNNCPLLKQESIVMENIDQGTDVIIEFLAKTTATRVTTDANFDDTLGQNKYNGKRISHGTQIPESITNSDLIYHIRNTSTVVTSETVATIGLSILKPDAAKEKYSIIESKFLISNGSMFSGTTVNVADKDVFNTIGTSAKIVSSAVTIQAAHSNTNEIKSRSESLSKETLSEKYAKFEPSPCRLRRIPEIDGVPLSTKQLLSKSRLLLQLLPRNLETVYSSSRQAELKIVGLTDVSKPKQNLLQNRVSTSEARSC